MQTTHMLPTSSICNGSLIQIKNFHINAFQTGLGMRRNSILYPIFENVMRKLIPSGIPKFLPESYLFLVNGNNENKADSQPKVLSVNNLAFGFILWLVACGISILGFVGEKIVYLVIGSNYSYNLWIRDFIGLVLLLYFIPKLI